MSYHLIVVQPYGKYAKGQKITDPDEIEKVLQNRKHHFVKINAPEAPQSSPLPPPTFE